MGKKINIVVFFLVLLFFLTTSKVYVKESDYLKFKWRDDSLNYEYENHLLNTPVIHKKYLYMNSWTLEMNNLLKIYDLDTGRLVGIIENSGVGNTIGLISNQNELFFFNEEDHVLTKLDENLPVWSKEITSYVHDIELDEKTIYIKTENKLIYSDFNGNIKATLDIEGQSVLVDRNNLFVHGEYLHKLNKENGQKEYKLDYRNNYRIAMQNDKYLFNAWGDMINKETGEVTKNICRGFAISDDYLVYYDHKDNQLVCIKIKEDKVIWRKRLNEYRTLEPMIHQNLLFIFTDTIEILDITNGAHIWKDTNKHHLEEQDLILKFVASEDYIVVLSDFGTVLVYKKEL